MNRNKLNKIAAIVAIVCGVMLVCLVTLTAPSLHPRDVFSKNFIMGFVFITIGILALRMKR